VVKVIAIGGGLPDFLGASCSGSVFSASAVFVRKSYELVFLEDGDAGTSFVEFLDVSEVPIEIYLLRRFISRKSSSWTVESTEILFTALLCPACALTFRTVFSLFCVTVCMP
jgi:hypothetical protein